MRTHFLKTLFVVSAALFLLGTSGCANLHTKSETLLDKGRYSEAEQLLEQQITDISSAKSGDLVWLCLTYFKVKKYNKLFICLDQLERNIEKGDKKISGDINVYAGYRSFPYDLTVIPHQIRAEAYIEMGDYAKAVNSAIKTYDLTQKMDWSLIDLQANWDRICRIRSLGILAMAYAFKGDNDAAQKYVEKLEKEGMGLFFRYFVEKEKTLALGKAYMALGRYDKVLEHSTDFILAYAHLFSFGLFKIIEDSAFAYVELPKMFVKNKALYETGQVKEAKEGYDKLLRRPETKTNGELYWPILFDRGRIYQGEGDTKKAIALFKEAIDVIESQRSTINTEANKIGFVGNKQSVYHQLIAALYSENKHATAFEYVERSKARVLVDLLASNVNIASKGTGQEASSLLKDLENTESEGKTFDILSYSADKIGERTARSIQIKEKIKTAEPELASLIAILPPSLAEIRSSMGSNSTIVEYYSHGEDLFSFIMTKEEIKAVKIDGKGLAEDVEQFRKALQDQQSSSYLGLSQKLYCRLIKPIEHLLTGQKLVIVPHGVLHYIPFNALSSGDLFLIEKYTISYLPSASVLKFLKQREPSKAGKALILGNPELGDEEYSLKYAEKEAVAVAKSFPTAKVLLKKEATESTFKKFAGQFNYIHLASHGLFASESPLNSGLLLAGDGENDGLLNVSDIYSLRLNAELISLSACETALGRINPGDDVVGLTRGFIYAGANSIMASLWQVDDMATAELMEMFYSLLKNTAKSDALRQAQLMVKRQYQHPYFWAAFQLTGLSD